MFLSCWDELVVYLSFSSHNIYIALLLCIEHCFTYIKILHFIYRYISIEKETFYRSYLPAIFQRERLCYSTSGAYFVEFLQFNSPPTTRSPNRNKEVLFSVNYYFGH